MRNFSGLAVMVVTTGEMRLETQCTLHHTSSAERGNRCYPEFSACILYPLCYPICTWGWDRAGLQTKGTKSRVKLRDDAVPHTSLALGPGLNPNGLKAPWGLKSDMSSGDLSSASCLPSSLQRQHARKNRPLISTIQEMFCSPNCDILSLSGRWWA